MEIFIYMKKTYNSKKFFARFNLELEHQPELMTIISNDQSNTRNFAN